MKQIVVLRRKSEHPGEQNEFRLHFGETIDFWRFLMYFFVSRANGAGIGLPDISTTNLPNAQLPMMNTVQVQIPGADGGLWGN